MIIYHFDKASTLSIVLYVFCIGNNPVLGDVLCIASGILFSLTVVSEELLIKGKLNIIDYLAFLGFSATVASSIQLLVLLNHVCIQVILTIC